MQSIGGTPLENLTTDFFEMLHAQGYKYLLEFICTLSGWMEAFFSGLEGGQMSAKGNHPSAWNTCLLG
jgi:hypothetical protein